jgi:hypothetical protein
MGDEVNRKWRELHNEELHDLYFSLNIIKYPNKMNMLGGGMYEACNTQF